MSEQERQERMALNESRFRDINDRVQQDLARLGDGDEPLPFVCECARLDCREQILLTSVQYERVRADPLQFVIAPEHNFPEAEDVVERREGVWLIRKHQNTAPVVEAADPRDHAEGAD